MGALSVKFWGTRGLFSSPRPETAIFGGNTSCVQILYKDHLILVDTGFGAANLGDSLAGTQGSDALEAHILFTHFHWDHIQGLPFFKPIYSERTTLNLYSPERPAHLLENLDVLFDGSYSPFESLLGMPAKINLQTLSGTLDLDGLKITFHAVDHGTHHDEHGETYAYRFIAPDGTSVCLVTDHEARQVSARNDAVVAFAKGCDLLIHDGQFRDEEYQKRIGWGHSSASMALENARRIEAGLTLLTHHDPSRDDRDLQRMHRELLERKSLRTLAFEFAREEFIYEVAKTALQPKAG